MTVFFDTGEPGTWRAVMPFLRNVRILPDVRLKRDLDAVEGGRNARPADVACSFHETGNTDV